MLCPDTMVMGGLVQLLTLRVDRKLSTATSKAHLTLIANNPE
jgi:hypothetical protein